MMKKIFLTVLLMAIIYGTTLLAQTPPHPNGGSDPNSGNTPVGGSAPLSGGIYILMALGAGYSLKRIYHIRNQSEELA